jgi:hypothetical protein
MSKCILEGIESGHRFRSPSVLVVRVGYSDSQPAPVQLKSLRRLADEEPTTIARLVVGVTRLEVDWSCNNLGSFDKITARHVKRAPANCNIDCGKKSGGTNGLDNDNWQQKPIHNVNIHNRTGSDVNIAASTVMASS